MVNAAERAWSIERRAVDMPAQARALPASALILVATGDARRPWSERTRRVAIDLARSIGARIVFYDRSAESRLVDAYPSGAMTADSDLPRGDRMLDARELSALGRGYLARGIEEAATAGVEAWGWLPRGVGRAALADAVGRFGVDLVVVAAEERHLLRERPGGIFRPAATRLDVPVLVAAPDGSVRDWQLAAELSSVGFHVRQFGFLVVRGEFSDFEVRLDFDENRPEATRVEARIAAASLSTSLGVRDRDLRGGSFFDVERYPYIAFASSRVSRDGGAYAIEGELEIKGRRRPVELRGEFHGIGSERGYRRATMSASATIDRRDWGVSGRPLIANDVTLSIRAVAVRASGGTGMDDDAT